MTGPPIGRERELQACDDALADVASGRRALLLVTGEPGIGKTRLLEALADRAAAGGARVAWGRTHEVGLTPAFWPWRQVLDNLTALDASDDPAPALEPGQPASGRERVDLPGRLARFDAVAAYLARHAARRPLAILFEDAHAADPSSLELLEYLVRHLHAGRLLLAVSARDTDGPEAARASLGRVARDARRLVLGPLEDAHVAAIVGRPADDPITGRICALSEGNPLFVHELLASTGAGREPHLPAVSGVRALIRDRVGRLPRETGQALAVAALVGRDFRGAVVAGVLQLGLAALLERLEPAVRAGLLMTSGPDGFRFSHALVTEALADDLPLGERAALHLAAAQAIVDHSEGDAIHAVAVHLLAAGHLAAGAAIAAARRAAAAAMGQLAFEDAAALLARALALAPPEELALRGELVAAEAEAWQHAGRHERGRAACERGLELARAAGSPALIARVALARGLEYAFGTTDARLVAMLGEALAALPPEDGEARARVLARLAAAEQPAPDPRGPVARALEAIGMARRLGDRRVLLDVIDVAYAALIEFSPIALLEGLLDELLGNVGPGDQLVAARARLRAVFLAFEAHDRARLDLAVAAHAALVARLGQPRQLWPAHLLRSAVAALDGRPADSAAAIEDALAVARGLADARIDMLIAAHRALAGLVLARPVGDVLRGLAAAHPESSPYAETWLVLHERDVELARSLAPRLAAWPLDNQSVLLLRAAVVAVAGEPEEARLVSRALETVEREVLAEAMTGSLVYELVDRVRLELAALIGAWEAVERSGERAAAVAAQLRSRTLGAQVRVTWAEALDRRGRAVDRARADALWAEAREVTEEVGMDGLLARYRAARPGPAGPVVGEAGEAGGHVRVVAEAAGLYVVGDELEEVHVKASRGLAMLARLVGEPGRELHALDLDGGDGAIVGDAGPVLDARARAAYQARLAALRERVEDAEERGDDAGGAGARAEIEALGAELARAVGLGGRERRSGSAAERARVNVQRRLAYAIRQVRAASPRLARLLANGLCTGVYCVYDQERAEAGEGGAK